MQTGQIGEILYFRTIVIKDFGHIYNLDILQIILLLMLKIIKRILRKKRFYK